MTGPLSLRHEYAAVSSYNQITTTHAQRRTFSETFECESQPDSFSSCKKTKTGNEEVNWLDGKLGTVLASCFGLKKHQQAAQQAMLKQPEPLSGDNPFQQGVVHLLLNGEALPHLLDNPEFQQQVADLVAVKAPLASKTVLSPQYLQASQEEKAALMLSHAGVGPGKIFQILADDPRVPDTYRTLFRQLQSKGAATRTLAETQTLVNQLYEPNRYQVEKELGVGTIGEVYLAKGPQQPVVIKLLKEGVTADNLEKEKQIAKALIREAFPNPKQQAYQLKRIENLYQQWVKELDFEQEAQNAKGLAKDGKRYQVAQSIAIGKLRNDSEEQAISLVQEIAPGVELKKLSEWLPLAEKDPDAYAEKIRDHAQKSPWLKHPDHWKDKLPKAFREAYNEQAFLRMNGDEEFVSHGDPHGGNIFTDINPTNGEPQITFIDAGLALKQNSRQLATQIGLLIGSISGNSRKISESILQNAEIPEGENREELAEALQQALDKRLYKAGVNLTDCQYNQQFLETLLEEKGIIVPEAETANFKAQMQAIRTYDQISQAVGQPQNNYLRDSIPDLYLGLKKLLWNQPLIAGNQLFPAGLHYWREGHQAIQNTLQFLVPKPVKINAESDEQEAGPKIVELD